MTIEEDFEYLRRELFPWYDGYEYTEVEAALSRIKAEIERLRVENEDVRLKWLHWTERCEVAEAEAERLTDEVEHLRTVLKALADAKEVDEAQIRSEWGVSTDPDYGELSPELAAARQALEEGQAD